MAFSKSTLIQRIRTRLNDNPFITACTEAMDASETGLDVTTTTKFDVGDIVEFQDDGEQCLVTALASGVELTVIRGFNGTTATTHSINTLTAKNPVFSYLQIEGAIAETLRDLWPNVYKEVNYTLTPVIGQKWYELDDGGDVATILDLSSVTQVYGATGSERIMYYGARRTGAFPANLRFNVPVSLAGSGVALYIPYLRHSTNSIFVNGITRITATVSGGNYSDITEGVEVDAVMYLAMSKLVQWTDISRSTQEDVTMSDESVRPLVRTQLSGALERQGYEARRRWEEELHQTLPRMWPKAGDGRFKY